MSGLFDAIPGWEKRKYLAFDIETEKIIPEGEPWAKYRPYGISCAATLRTGDDQPIKWYHGQYGDPQAGPMTTDEIDAMINYMIEQYRAGYIPLTWNGVSFDFDVLNEESGGKYIDNLVEFSMKGVDMMLHVHAVKGFTLGLDSAAHGMGLHGKTEGMHGDLVPIMWPQSVDDRLKCIEYVMQDARTTLEVCEAVEKKKKLDWIARSGRFNSMNINEWLTVEKAFDLPLPNTAWMTDPIPRQHFVEWIEKAKEKKDAGI